MTEERKIKIGDAAPAFHLRDQDENKHDIANYIGKRVLLSFHPLAWTRVCAEQMQSLEENYHALHKLNTVALGISIDTIPCKKAWSQHLEIDNTPLLADFWPHGNVAKMLGVFKEDHGFSERANIILDEKGKVAFTKIYPLTKLPDINEVLDFLKKMK